MDTITHHLGSFGPPSTRASCILAIQPTPLTQLEFTHISIKRRTSFIYTLVPSFSIIMCPSFSIIINIMFLEGQFLHDALMVHPHSWFSKPLAIYLAI